MGCDIHAWVEYRSSGESEAQVFGEIWFGRNYELFGLIAGVRGYEMLFSPRGLPEGMDSMLAKDFDPKCYHSASYLSTSELSTVCERLSEIYREDGDEERDVAQLAAVVAAMRELENLGCEQVRLIFWFDS
ncbi:hypothetical protein MRY87_06035 [bacterium]|nr:hypothetical protein [bacterium]